MNIKDKASKIKQLEQDPTFQELVNETRQEQVNVFLNPNSSLDERKVAHDIVRALVAIESRIEAIKQEEAIFDKRNR